jgi:hypothetical protein
MRQIGSAPATIRGNMEWHHAHRAVPGKRCGTALQRHELMIEESNGDHHASAIEKDIP